MNGKIVLNIDWSFHQPSDQAVVLNSLLATRLKPLKYR